MHDKENCLNCRFAYSSHEEEAYEDPDYAHLVDPNDLSYLFCHRYPPKPNLGFTIVPMGFMNEDFSLLHPRFQMDSTRQVVEDEFAHAQFTIVHPNAWCGEWQRRNRDRPPAE